MRIKKVVAFMLIGILFLFQSVPVHAQMPLNELPEKSVDIVPYWINVNDIQLDLFFQNGEANCVGRIRALSGTTSISAVFKLERKTLFGWSLVKS